MALIEKFKSLTKAIFRQTCLVDADLNAIDQARAKITDADVKNVYLEKVDFASADLKGADLSGAKVK